MLSACRQKRRFRTDQDARLPDCFRPQQQVLERCLCLHLHGCRSVRLATANSRLLVAREAKSGSKHRVYVYAASCSGITGAEMCTVAQGWPRQLIRRLTLSCLASLSCLPRVLLLKLGVPINIRFLKQESLNATTPC